MVGRGVVFEEQVVGVGVVQVRGGSQLPPRHLRRQRLTSMPWRAFFTRGGEFWP